MTTITTGYTTSRRLSLTRFLLDKCHCDSLTHDCTEYRHICEQLLKDNGYVTVAHMNWTIMPTKILRTLSNKISALDLSYNNFQNLSFLSHFTRLSTLVLDYNTQMKEETFPAMPELKFLWMNSCNITDIYNWVQVLKVQCPNLTHLSLMRNPGSRTMIDGKSYDEEQRYRAEINSILTNLASLDCRLFPAIALNWKNKSSSSVIPDLEFFSKDTDKYSL